MGERQGLLAFVRNIVRVLRGRPEIPPSVADNALLQTVLQRRSVRSFTQTEIPDDVFDAILEAGRLAPSTVNLQTWSFAPFTRESWRDAFQRPIPFGARRAVIVMGDTHRARLTIEGFPESPLVSYSVAVMNASLAAMNMNVAAEALGVASVMLSETGRTGLLDCGYLKRTLSLPDGVYPLLTIVFGYPRAPRPPMPPKLGQDQICFQGRYEEPDREVMEDWLAQMRAAYKASRPTSSFEAQLRVYASKIVQAEEELEEMVLPKKQGRD